MSGKKSSKSSLNSDDRGNTAFVRNFTHQCEENGLSTIPILKFKQIILPDKISQKSKKESTRKNTSSTQPVSVESDDSSDPKTFKIVDNLRFLQPCVELYQKTQGSPDTVQDIRIRGWKFDEASFAQLRPLFINFKGLHTLSIVNDKNEILLAAGDINFLDRFWSAGLTPQMIVNIGLFVAESKTLRILKVEANNRIDPETYYELIPLENSGLVHLSLRFTKMSAEGLHKVAGRFGNNTKWNNSVISLDLTGCAITDLGMCYLAEALRTNRRLKYLTLTNNQIGDLGVMALCETLTKFFLTDDELALRRILQGEYLFAETQGRDIADGFSLLELPHKDTSKQAASKKGGRSSSRPVSATKKASREKNKSSQQRKMTREVGNTKSIGEMLTREQILDNLESKHPLLAAGENIPPHGLRIHGNYEVSMINLMHNRITIEGVKLLTEMLQIQTKWHSAMRDETRTGIIRLVLSGNHFDETAEASETLRHLLRERSEELWSTDISETASVTD